VLLGCFDRPNLTYRVVPKSDPIGQILAAVRVNADDAAIVYCISRKDTEKTAAALKARGVSAAAYHAGLDARERRQVSEDFAQERLNVVVATVAFGMGIDRSNVRCVIHESMPKSIESYQQETGRAGRDGIPSECLMLYAPNDYIRWERVIRESGSPDQIALQVGMIDEVRRFAVGTKCRHAFLSEYFGQGFSAPENGNCGACDLCLEGWQVVTNSTKLGHQIISIVSALQRLSDVGFGGRHVAEVLAGSKTKGIRQFGHESLRGYGAMAGTPIERITTWVHQLVDLGLLRRVGGQYPVLQVTPEGTNALNSRAEILLRDVALPVTKRQRQGDRPESFDESIFEALRQARREIAIARGVPAYVIFHDSVLVAIASQRPTTADGLAQISGMGEKRTTELGEIVLRIVRAEVEARKLGSDLAPGQAAQPTIRVENTTASRLKTYFEQGLPLQEIAEVAGLSKSTVANYLSDSIVSGAISDISPWVPEDVDQRIRAALDEHGSLRLRPIFEALEEAVPYDQIRLVVRLAEREQA